MRLVRPIALFVLLCGFTASVQSQIAPGTGGVNMFLWNVGSPTGTMGGVDASTQNMPSIGWNCSSVTLRVVDDSTNKTLDEYTATNPGPTVSKSFTGFDSNLKVRVDGEATFKNGGNIDFKDIEAIVTTK